MIQITFNKRKNLEQKIKSFNANNCVFFKTEFKEYLDNIAALQDLKNDLGILEIENDIYYKNMHALKESDTFINAIEINN